MIETLCGCGATLRAHETAVGFDVPCNTCNRPARLIAAEPIPVGTGIGDFDTRLIVEDGPGMIGHTFALGGVPDLTLGKSSDRHVPLAGSAVSRSHAKMVRLDFGPSRWKVVDTASRNGVYVNDEPVGEVELKNGDRVRIGEYVLRYSVGFPPPPNGVKCPSCKSVYPKDSTVCTSCGINLLTGKPLVISHASDDDDDVAEQTQKWIYIVSWFMWLGLWPVASEAYGTHKPRATWIITAVTIVISAFFLLAQIGNGGTAPPELRDYMMWTGSRSAQTRQFERLANKYPEEREQIMDALAKRRQSDGEFQWYQPLTNAFLHEGIMHLAGNLLFLFIFGLRVNQLIGDVKFSVVYPVLAVLASLAHYASQQGQPLMASLGASGAIMGLAGMYFVFFPVQRVHMVFWKRSVFLGFRLYYKLFSMKGFWMLVLWIGLQDLLPTLIAAGSNNADAHDGVAHFAHLGGFVAGVVIAVLMLITRQVNAHGADLLSVSMGTKAWNLIGRPEGREAMAA